MLTLSRILGAALLGLAPLVTSAQWHAGFYSGVSQTRDFAAGAQPHHFGAQDTIDGGTHATFGARAGYWFASVPWFGLAGDFSIFRVARDLRVLNGSLLFMARPASVAGIESRFEPYVALGLAQYQSLLKVGETDCPPPCAFGQAPVEEESDYGGPDYRAGLTWWFGTSWGLLGEYRYTKVKASFPSLPGPLRFKTHHANLGLVYRWDR